MSGQLTGGLEAIQKKVKEGDIQAQLDLAKLYRTGKKGCDRSASEAMKLYQGAAQKGNAMACFAIGMMYKNGEADGKRDPSEAKKWFEKAKAMGYDGANAAISLLSSGGQGFQNRLLGGPDEKKASQSTTTTSPVESIHKTPVMPLSEACKSLKVVFEDIDQYVKLSYETAEKKLKEENKAGLNKEEIAAINLYTRHWDKDLDSLYAVLNRRLRAEDKDGLVPFVPYLKLLLTALNKLQKQEDVVWRGVKADLTGAFEKGKKITWWAFNSFTLDCELLQNELYLGKTGKRTIFLLHTKIGVEIIKYSDFPNESEMLLQPGVCFEVTGVLQQGDLQIVHLKQLNSIVVI